MNAPPIPPPLPTEARSTPRRATPARTIARRPRSSVGPAFVLAFGVVSVLVLVAALALVGRLFDRVDRDLERAERLADFAASPLSPEEREAYEAAIERIREPGRSTAER